MLGASATSPELGANRASPFVGSSRTSPFVGRAGELAALVEALGADHGRVVLLAGEPGIGKSRLVAEALTRSTVTVLVGTTSPASLGRPFDLVLSMVEPAVRWWDTVPPALVGIDDSLTRLLRSIAPALAAAAGPLSDPPGAAGPDRVTVPSGPPAGELIGAGIALLRHLAPDAIVVEDLHWADIESLQVLERLLALPDPPTIIATYRNTALPADHPAAELLRTIERRRAPLHIHLEPFDLGDVRDFVAAALRDDPGEEALTRLRHRSGGNPFFLEQLLSCERGVVTPFDEASLPRTLTETLDRHLDSFTTEERELLTLAAVLGSRFEFDVLAEVTHLDESDLIGQLRSLITRGLVEEDGVDTFRFRHELVRESILGSLLGRERRRLHDRAFLALQIVRPDDVAELARHAQGANRIENLVEVAPGAVAHYLAVGSSYQALVLARAALAVLTDHPPLTELAARAAWLCGQLDAAQKYAERWRGIAARDQPERVDDALTLLARIAFERGDETAQRALVDELEDVLAATQDGPQRARVLASLAQHRMLADQSVEAIRLADEAIAIADRHGLDDVRRRARIERASAMLHLDARPQAPATSGTPSVAGPVPDPDPGAVTRDAVTTLLAVAEECERAGDDIAAARAWHNVSTAQTPDDAEISVRRMRDAAIRCGFESMAVNWYAGLRGWIALGRADLAGARQWAGRLRLFGTTTKTSARLALLEAQLALEAGDDVEHVLADLESLTIDNDRDGGIWIAATRLAALARGGDLPGALEILDTLANAPELPAVVTWTLRDVLDAGATPAELRARLDAATDAAPSDLLAVAHALAATAEHAPDAPDMVAAAIDALPASAPLSRCATPAMVVVAPELHLAAARLALDHGDGTEADTHAQAAASMLERWPGRRRDAALSLIASAHARPMGDGTLTGRELDVARLVARGLTNGEIADQLYIGRKTVSTHVSNILTKLAMRSRTEVAAWVIRTGVSV